jgi:hypothetical protein
MLFIFSRSPLLNVSNGSLITAEISFYTSTFSITDAHATTVDECDGLITGDQEALGGVIIGGNNVERTKTGLKSKLSGESKKLGQAIKNQFNPKT